jgi:hypothetical protein
MMTQIENALKVYWREMPSPYEISVADDAAAVRHISAYLSALPLSVDVAELVRRGRKCADDLCADGLEDPAWALVHLADAVTAQAAKIAELEVDRNEALNAAVDSSEIAGEACIKAHDATARAKRLEALIRPIAQLAVMGDEKSDPRWKDAPKGDEDIIQVNISLGQLRAMRAALSPALSEGGDDAGA